MNSKLQVSTQYIEVFETNPSHLESINLTIALLKSLLLTRVRVSE